MKKIVLVNNKGGIGKTTSSQNIGAYLALQGFKVLMMDLDPQTNLTDCFACFNPERTIYHSFSKNEPLPVVEIKKNLSLVPSSFDFAGIEVEISNKMRRENILSKLLVPLEDQFDYCIMDCPPSLGLITINALTAGDHVLIPMEAEYLSFRGIETVKGMINNVKEEINPGLNIAGVFFTKLKPALSLSKAIREEVAKNFGEILCDTAIRVNIALAEAQSNGKDIFEYDPTSNGAQDYSQLVKEILKRVN
jgi:chromosome partitioning protein